MSGFVQSGRFSSPAEYTILTSQTPAANAANGGTPFTLGTKFSSSAAGSVLGVRLYKATTGAWGGTVYGNLWSNTGTNLGQVEFVGIGTAVGWYRADFASPIAIDASTYYVVSWYCPASSNFGYTTTLYNSAVTNGPLTAPATGTTANGLYASGGASPTFPTTSGTGTSYFADAVVLV